MAQENVASFEQLLRSDEALQAKMRAAAEAFGGDVNDERAVYDAVIAPLANEVGLPFTFEEAKEAAESGAELSDDELEAVAGGAYGCFVIGGGQTGACWGMDNGAGYCSDVGIGIMVW